MNNIEEILKAYSARFNARMPEYFALGEGEEKRVVEAMFYSLSNGGKRLRPFLLFEAAGLFQVSFERSINAAMSLEMLHTYSLIHDDLPAMDDDDLRRGKPTCHKQFDEATAILAGDGLLTYAFELLAREEKCAELVRLLGQAAGAFGGMISGQMLDLMSEGKEVSQGVIRRIEEQKTGRLIRYAAEAGCVLGNAGEAETEALVSYSRKIGMAFQIADDVLDVEGNAELVGKNLQKDQGRGKTTFVSLYGVQRAKEMARELVSEAKEALKPFGERAGNLALLADYIISREY